MKGIVLAGGTGSRLYPLTRIVCKQLLPIYDKPMICYPLSTLMLGGMREICIISTPRDLPIIESFLGDGSDLGVEFTYVVQEHPEGIAQAFLLAEEFLAGEPACLILGDNIFYGHDLQDLLQSADQRETGATVFAYHVKDPERYGVAEFDDNNQVISLEEKPTKPKSNYAVTGLYFYDQKVVELANHLKPSARGELEITDLNKLYLDSNELFVEMMDRGYAWLDTGTHDSLLDAGQFISTIENRQGLKVACPEEIAYRKQWITKTDLTDLAKPLMKNQYGEYLLKLIK